MSAPTIESLADELRTLHIEHFDYDFVWRLGSSLREAGKKAGLPIAIQVRHGEDVVFSTLLPGATSDNFDWARRKCAVAHRFQKSSLAVKLDAQIKGYDLNRDFRLPAADFVASGGAMPLLLTSGAMIGTVAVSGLPDIEDHALVVTTLRRLTSAS